MKNKIFISGPMTGLLNHNMGAFMKAQKDLYDAGWIVRNPYLNGVDKKAPREEHMHADLQMLLECDMIYSLIGWDKSIGATLEYLVAKQLGLGQILQRMCEPIPKPSDYKEADYMFHSFTYEQLCDYKVIYHKRYD